MLRAPISPRPEHGAGAIIRQARPHGHRSLGAIRAVARTVNVMLTRGRLEGFLTMKKQSILCLCLCLTVVCLTVACSTPNQAGEPADATEQQDSLRPFEPDVGGDTAQTPDAGADVVEDSASSDIQELDGAADKDVGDASGGEDTVSGDAGSRSTPAPPAVR